MKWYLEALKKYAVFRGRATGAEYWYFSLVNFLVSIALLAMDNIIGSFDPTMGMGLLSTSYGLAVTIPGLALTTRRLHDINKSAWWCLFAFIPILGPVVLLFFAVQASNSGENKYGLNPKVAYE